MTTELPLVAQEEGTYVINAAFKDEDGADVVPDSATWTLSDEEGNIVNSRNEITITGLATSKDIVLSGDDLALTAALHGNTRVFLIEGTYTSTLGVLPLKEQAKFDIENLVKVP
jgi:hypothetical protein